MSKEVLRPRKRFGRMRRVRRLGIIVPVEGEEVASKGEGKAGELEG